ncbi:cation-translocating P-type ATPase [Rufibacter soli]
MTNTSALPHSLPNPHALTPQELATALGSSLPQGLKAEEIAGRLQQWGPNQIEKQRQESLLLVLLHQFTGPITFLLMAAMGLSFLFQEWLDGIAILLVILVNGFIGFFMEYNARKSMEALREMALVLAKVLRGGRLEEISSEHLVPGDVLFLEAGDMISADARLFQTQQLEVNESALTGESIPIAKRIEVLPPAQPLAERLNMVFKGSFVTKGNGYALVIGTGMSTELGQIASLVQSASQSATPLEKKLESFSHKLIKITIVLCFIVFGAGLFQHRPWMESLSTAIALAVAAIPEGLTIVATLALAQGMLRMARHQVIVKKLSAVETLGSTNVICTDKTGTLTKNRIEVTRVAVPGTQADLTSPPLEGNITLLLENPQLPQTESYRQLLLCAVLCNTARYEIVNQQEKEVGDPVETGLLKFALAAGLPVEEVRAQYPKLAEESFSSETKVMGTLHQKEGQAIIYAKGAMEELLQRCTSVLVDGQPRLLTPQDREEWQEKEEQMAREGLKVLAFAYKNTQETRDMLLEDLVFLGLTGLLDPPREDVKQALTECASAGIDVKMITGDHPATARNIAAQVGISQGLEALVIHGSNMPAYEQLSEQQKKEWLQSSVFARVSPRQKLDLVTLLQDNQMVVGMTGDGVNDAPALKKADIGIAMGIRGTQVAQEVADMILQDDSFSSIVLAIKQGRIIFDNIRKFVIFLLSCNLSELFLVTMVSLLGFNFQLLPIQILFINLVTDVLPALALGVSPGTRTVMQHKPRHLEEPILKTAHWISLVVYAAVISACVIGAVSFGYWVVYDQSNWDPNHSNNILFFTLIMCQLWHVFNMGSSKGAFYRNEVFTNKYVWLALFLCLVVLALALLVPTLAQALRLSSFDKEMAAVILGFSLLSFFLNLALRKLHIIY